MTDENVCALVEQSVGTLQTLMDVLANLDDNLKAILPTVSSAQDSNQQQLATESPQPSECIEGEQIESGTHDSQIQQDSNPQQLTTELPESPDNIQEELFNLSSGSQIIIRVEEYDDMNSNPVASVGIAEPVNELSNEEPNKSGTQPKSSSMQKPTTSRVSNEQRTRKLESSVKRNEKLPMKASSGKASESRNQSQQQKQNKKPSQMESKSQAKSASKLKPSTIEPPAKSDDSQIKGIEGRLTAFLNQFEKHVNDVAGKIDTLNQRVKKLGYISSDAAHND